MIPDLAMCDFEGATWLFFNNAYLEPVVYWAHFSAFFLSTVLAIYIFLQNRKALPNKIFFVTLLGFIGWVFFSSLNNPTNRGDIMLFTWAATILLEPIVYMGSIYLLHVLIDKRDMSFNKKLFLAILYLPVIIATPTKYMLDSFDMTTCLAIEGPIGTFYTYSLELIVIIWIIGFAVGRYRATTERRVKNEIIFLSLGTLFLLVAFSWGNIIGSFTDNWTVASYGLFGMPIFSGFLIYSIVRYQTFNIKLLASVALVLTLMALIFVGLFV